MLCVFPPIAPDPPMKLNFILYSTHYFLFHCRTWPRLGGVSDLVYVETPAINLHAVQDNCPVPGQDGYQVVVSATLRCVMLSYFVRVAKGNYLVQNQE